MLSHLVNEINAQCASVSLTRTADCVRQMSSRKEYRPISKLAETLAQAFDGMADDERASELYMAGTSRLAHQRAVADLAPLFDALEEQVVLMKLMSTLSETTQSDGVGVAIGSETHTPGLLHASVVTSGYGRTSATADDVTKARLRRSGERDKQSHHCSAGFHRAHRLRRIHRTDAYELCGDHGSSACRCQISDRIRGSRRKPKQQLTPPYGTMTREKQ